MNAALTIALFGLAAAIAWGISDFLSAKSVKSVGPVLSAVLVNFIGSVIFTVIFAVFFREHTTVTAAGLGYAISSAIIMTVGMVIFYKGLEAGPVSIVSPLTSTYPLLTTIIGIVVFHAHLAGKQIFAIALTVFGVIAASGLLNAEKSERKLTKGPAYALLSAVIWGTGFALIAQAIKHMDWQLVTLINFFVTLLATVALIPVMKGKEVISWQAARKGLGNKFVLSASVLQMTGAIALDIGISKSTATSGAVVTAISASYPLLTIFLALKNLDETISLVPLAGALVGIAGVIMLSLG